MVGKLSRLPAETQDALQQLACLGNIAEITTLSIVLGTSEEQVHAALWEAVRQELVERSGGRLPVRPRSRSGSRLFADPGRAARRGAPSDRADCSRRTHLAGEAGGGDLRDRQSAQPRRGLDHLTRGARAARRAQPDRGQARQGLDRLCLGAHLSHRRRGAAAGRLLGAPARARPSSSSCTGPNASS